MTKELRAGLLAGVGAYLCWGFFPLFFPLLEPATAVEIIAHRVVWSLSVVLLVLAVTRNLGRLWAVLRDPRLLGGFALAGALLAVNWLAYVYGTLSGRVVDASLGYFTNPIVTALLAVLVLRERLRPLQWAALGVAGAGVAVIAVGTGTVPWIALTLAFSFGLYGLVKKRLARVEALPGLGAETIALAPVALAYIAWTYASGTATFGVAAGASVGVGGHAALMVLSGVITAGPLLMFAAAARRLPLVTVGILQFITPVLQFLLGVLVMHEPMAPSRWAGFALVWVALALFMTDAVRATRRPSPDATSPADRDLTGRWRADVGRFGRAPGHTPDVT